MTETTFNHTGEKLDAIIERVKARMDNKEQKDVYDALMDAVSDEMTEGNGCKDYFDVGYHACIEVVAEFNAWVVKRHEEIRRKLLNLESHARDMLPFYNIGVNRVVEHEFEHTCGQAFALRVEFELFDSYYYAAVSGESEMTLEKDKLGVDRLWEKFVQSKQSLKDELQYDSQGTKKVGVG